MPKNKTHSGAAKRFKVTGKGKLRRERAGHRHILEKKAAKQKRRLEGRTDVAANDVRQAKKLLGR